MQRQRKRSGAQDLDALKRSLWEKSDQGRRGVTPDMAKDIVDSIMAQQGYVSPDMGELLDAVQKDGPKLSDDTFLKLQSAAREAKAAGLELNIKPETERSLLNYKPESKSSASPDVD